MQWLMLADQNERIQKFFRGRFPRLGADEALLENAYTPPEYRGKGIMSTAMSLITERARSYGCRYVITFVSKDNTPSLKGCAKAGFYPFLVRHDSHTLFHLIRSRRFEVLEHM
jgi:RimJ/RimL family protein N-acetyltransferase